jgi:FtsP/CotA-like multicopper oxidase with cupredoxin domain
MVLLLVACRDTPTREGDGRTAPSTGDTGSSSLVDGTGLLRPVVVDPPDAPDLDPDPAILHVALTAAVSTIELDGEQVEAWTYDGTVPGPTLRAHVGDRLIVDLTNGMDAETTIHWHGVHVPYAMDGVTWQTAPVEPGGTFTYDFVLDRAGTFWYHPHFDSDGQVDRGLYGLLVVEDPDEPVPDADLAWVFDVWGESSEDADAEHGFAPLPGPWRVNGLVDPRVAVAGGRTVRARILNASNIGYLALSWPGLSQIGSDQGLLAERAALEPLVLAPGDRAVVELSPGEDDIVVTAASYTLAGSSEVGDPVQVLTIDPSPGGAPAAPLAWPFSGSSPSVDPGTTDIVYVFAGDPHSGQWLINGEMFPDVTIETLPLGDEAVIEVRNLSPTQHPFHLHGMPVEVLSIDGVAPTAFTVEDTLNVAIRQTVRLKVLADNPGDWMAHCHILPHAHDGMMTVLRVE